MSWYDIYLTFDRAAVTFTFNILSGPYLRNCKVWEVDTWLGHWLGGVGMPNHGVPFNLGSAKVSSPAIFEIYLCYHKDI